MPPVDQLIAPPVVQIVGESRNVLDIVTSAPQYEKVQLESVNDSTFPRKTAPVPAVWLPEQEQDVKLE